MKRSVLALAIVAGLAAVSAVAIAADRGLLLGRQRLSPRTTASGTVDGCRIQIDYGAPSKRGRVIWGGLRPWGLWWMPGADQATTITTSAPLVVGGTLTVPAGVHTIYTLPNPDSFQLIINNETGQFHTVYHPNRDLGRVPMTLRMLDDPIEQMTFAVTPDPAGGGTLSLSWDDREYSVALAGGAARESSRPR